MTKTGDNGSGPAPDADFEREHVEQLARAHAALAAAQDRSYWLDRWGIDLNELMRRPAGNRIRVALRAARRGKVLAIEAKRRLAREAREAAEELAATPAAPADDPLARAVGRPVATPPASAGELVVEALGAAGLELAPGLRALDFGCGTGATVGALAADHPEIRWHGVDTDADAVAAAAENVSGAELAAVGSRPPLPFEDGAFDLAYALSAWTRLAPTAAAEWLAELRRVVRPGGLLALAANGPQTVAHEHSHGLRPADELLGIRDALYRSGSWFDAGPADAGAVAFLTAEWLLSHADGWKVAGFLPGRGERGRDVYVLERR